MPEWNCLGERAGNQERAGGARSAVGRLPICRGKGGPQESERMVSCTGAPDWRPPGTHAARVSACRQIGQARPSSRGRCRSRSPHSCGRSSSPAGDADEPPWRWGTIPGSTASARVRAAHRGWRKSLMADACRASVPTFSVPRRFPSAPLPRGGPATGRGNCPQDHALPGTGDRREVCRISRHALVG